MALARGLTLRDDHAFEQRTATILAIVDDVGSPSLEDTGKADALRRFQVEVDVAEAPLEVQARFRYLEWWSRDGRGWRLAKYQYDYFDRVHRSRLAYHRHDLAGEPDLLHIHCEPPGTPPSARHFRAYEVDLLEAHDEFSALYASGRAIDCVGLRPLHVD
jgi:hypothetical protein